MNICGNRQYSCKLKFKAQNFLDRNPRQVIVISTVGRKCSDNRGDEPVIATDKYWLKVETMHIPWTDFFFEEIPWTDSKTTFMYFMVWVVLARKFENFFDWPMKWFEPLFLHYGRVVVYLCPNVLYVLDVLEQMHKL